LNKTKKDRWVLGADIRGAFDNISHNFILEKLGLVPGRKYAASQIWAKIWKWCRIGPSLLKVVLE